MLIVVAVLAIVPFLLRKQSPEAKAAERIRNAVAVAEEPVHKPGSGNPEAEKFLLDLKAVDQSGASSNLKAALQSYISVVESNLVIRRAGQDPTDSNYQVREARKRFLRAVDSDRGQPY